MGKPDSMDQPIEQNRTNSDVGSLEDQGTEWASSQGMLSAPIPQYRA
jgi:hypothetical protein